MRRRKDGTYVPRHSRYLREARRGSKEWFKKKRRRNRKRDKIEKASRRRNRGK